jgi:hypothetical protein
LEELAAHGVLARGSRGEGKADVWSFNETLRLPYLGFSRQSRLPAR